MLNWLYIIVSIFGKTANLMEHKCLLQFILPLNASIQKQNKTHTNVLTGQIHTLYLYEYFAPNARICSL